MAPVSPAVIAWELGIRMREAREQVGLSGVKAAKKVGVSQNYLSDVERGKRKLTEETLVAAAPVYGISADDQEELTELRKQVDQRGWWSKYSGVFADDVLRYFGFEYGAEFIQSYECLLVPGLLQTEEYAYEIVMDDPHNIRTSEARQRVEARLRRQRRLTDTDPLRFTVVVSEAVLKQQVGGSAVLARQLQHLLSKIEELPENLEFRVVPFTAGAHGALGASTYHVLDFQSPKLPSALWHEGVTMYGFVAHPMRVNEFSMTFAAALRQAADRKGSLDLIYRAMREIT